MWHKAPRSPFLVTLLVPMLGLVGCFGSQASGGGADAGTRTAPANNLATELVQLPGCEDGEPNLIEGFTLPEPVDYLADRWGEQILSSQGTPCATAPDPVLCQGKVDAAASFVRNLLTVQRGEVRIWEREAAISLFGTVDTVAEAAWLAASVDYRVPCTAKVARVFDLYIFDDAEALYGCRDPQAIVTLSVSPFGQVNELSFVPVQGALCEVDPMQAFPMGFAGAGAIPPPVPVPF